jgi:hypothetical protein
VAETACGVERNLNREFQYRVVHLQGRTGQTRPTRWKLFPDGDDQARHTSYPELDLGLELFTTHDSESAAPPRSPPPRVPSLISRCSSILTLWSRSRVQTALPSNPILGPQSATGGGGGGDPGERPCLVPSLFRALRRAPLPPEPAGLPLMRPCRRGKRLKTFCHSNQQQ